MTPLPSSIHSSAILLMFVSSLLKCISYHKDGINKEINWQKREQDPEYNVMLDFYPCQNYGLKQQDRAPCESVTKNHNYHP